jgi:ATP-dependent DNA ligase
MLAPAARPFNRPGWIFELKYDGFRVLAGTNDKKPHLISRRGNDLLPCYPEIGACLLELREMVMDGELVVLDAHGRSDFETLRRRLALRRPTSVDSPQRKPGRPSSLSTYSSCKVRTCGCFRFLNASSY